MPYCTDLHCRKDEDFYLSKRAILLVFFRFRVGFRARTNALAACYNKRILNQVLAFTLQREFIRDMFQLPGKSLTSSQAAFSARCLLFSYGRLFSSEDQSSSVKTWPSSLTRPARNKQHLFTAVTCF